MLAAGAPRAALTDDEAACVARYERPSARVRCGRIVGSSRAASACMDLSDGLADAVLQIAQASGTGADLMAEAVPVAPGAQDFFASDGVNVYAVNSFLYEEGVPVSSCPIVKYGRECVSFLINPDSAPLSVDIAVDTAGVVGPPGATYLFIGSYYGDIYRCPVADSGSVHCTQLASQSGQRHPAGMVVANGYLWVALEHGGRFGNGLLWRCGLWTNDDCQVFDDPKGPDLLSLEVGGGYLWVGRSDGVIWRCDMAAANHCAVWDTAGGSIEALSYDGAGTLYAAVQYASKKKPGVVWSCSTAHANGCLTVPADTGTSDMRFALNVEAGGGGVFNVSGATDSQPRLNFGSLPLSDPSNDAGSMSLLYVPAGGLAPLGAARIGLPDLTGRLAKVGALCAKAKARARAGKVWADLVVTGAYGVRFHRRVDVCAPNAAGWSFGSLDPGRYSVRVRVHKIRLRGSATVSGGGVTEIRACISTGISPCS